MHLQSKMGGRVFQAGTMLDAKELRCLFDLDLGTFKASE